MSHKEDMAWYSNRPMPSLWSQLKGRDALVKQHHSYIPVGYIRIYLGENSSNCVATYDWCHKWGMGRGGEAVGRGMQVNQRISLQNISIMQPVDHLITTTNDLNACCH
jgi:hypothetical protein